MMHRAGVLLVVFHFLADLQMSHQRSSPGSPTYKAAVMEYAPPPGITMDNKEEHFRYNVEAYRYFTETAAGMDADIIVFPECGLVSLGLPRHPDGSPALAVTVPAPSDGVVPCLDSHYEGLKNLSCAARDSAIYLVVNVPEKSSQDLQDVFYNTDVVFDRQGAVIARYRKTHLFGERGFTSPPETDFTVFETDFGVRFGIFTCFDLMFEQPGMKLIQELGVRDIVFPTAWFSELPFLTAVQAQDSWAVAMDVNFLGAGYNFPQVGSGGSGIYAGRKGAVVATMPDTRGSHLLVASVLKKSSENEEHDVGSGLIIPVYPDHALLKNCFEREELVDNILGSECPEKDMRGQRGFLLKKEHLENYTSLQLTPQTALYRDQFTLSSGDLQCSFKLEMNFNLEAPVRSEMQPTYHLVAFDGVRTFDGLANGGLQVCAIILCPNDKFDSCGHLVENPGSGYSSFSGIEISGEFNGEHSAVLPSTLGDEHLLPVPATSFEFQTTRAPGDKLQALMRSSEEHFTFLTFGLYAVQAQDSWAVAMDVNFLGAGYNFPQVGSGGSGIYAGRKGAVVATMPDTRGSHLLVASVLKKSSENEEHDVGSGLIIPVYPDHALLKNCFEREELVDNILGSECPEKDMRGQRGFLLKKEHLENYTSLQLTPQTALYRDQFTLSSGDLQCSFKLEMNFNLEAPVRSEMQPTYHLVAFDGVRTFDGLANGGLQVCAIILCPNDKFDSCGHLVENPGSGYSSFSGIEISGEFNGEHSAVLPSTLGDEHLLPVPATSFEFQTTRAPGDKLQALMRSSEEHFTFLTFGLYGRNFVTDSP